MEITIHSAWVITVPILPPEAIQALINGGVVQGKAYTNISENPIIVMKYPNAIVANGVIIKGIINNGLSIIGKPKCKVSEILKIFGDNRQLSYLFIIFTF